MPDEKTYRRRRAVFVLLVAAAFVLLTGSFVGAFGGTERGFAGIVSPIQEGASKVVKPVRDLTNWVGDTFRAKGDLDDLREERDALQIANGQLSERLSVLGQAQNIAEIESQATLDRYGPVAAKLSSSSSSSWYRNIQIDKGTGDGVRPGNPVIGSGGLVGRVIRAQGGSAVVRLITDPASGVTAKVMNARDPRGQRGVLAPAKIGAIGDLILDIPKTSAYRAGDRVYTAGSTSTKLESRFPPGIPIGKITRIEDADTDTQVVHVQPSADLRRLDLVRVLTAAGTEEQ